MNFLFFIDTETKTEQIRGELFNRSILWCWTSNFSKEEYKARDFDECINAIVSFYFVFLAQNTILSGKFHRLTITAHNLDYEFTYIHKWLIENDYKDAGILSNSKLSKKTKYFKIKYFNNSIYGLSLWVEKGGKKVLVDFKCTYLFSRLSIEAMGKVIGKQKANNLLTKNYDDYEGNEEELINYCKTDVAIPRDFFEAILDLYQIKTIKTASGISKEFFARIQKKQRRELYDLGQIKNYEDWLINKLGYQGGLTLFNKIKHYDLIYDVYGVDFNSMYPFFNTFPLPQKCVKKEEYDKYDGFKCVMIQCIVTMKPKKPNTPNLAISFISPTCKIQKDSINYEVVYYWEKELEIKKLFYDVVIHRIISTWYFIGSGFDKEAIIELYNKKLEASKNIKLGIEKEKNEVIKEFTKLLLNSHGGSYGIRPVFSNIFLGSQEEFEKNVLSNKKYELLREKLTKKNGLTQWEYKLKNEFITQKMLSPVFIISYITMLSRVRMQELIYDLGDDFLYCDTDGFKFINSPKAWSIINPLLDEHELGKLKVEKHYKVFYYDHKKFYFGLTDKGEFDGHTGGLDNLKLGNSVKFNKEEYKIFDWLEFMKKMSETRKNKGSVVFVEGTTIVQRQDEGGSIFIKIDKKFY